MFSIILNEWRMLFRSRIAVVLFIILAFLAVFTTWQATKAFRYNHQERQEATAHMRQKFTGQGEVNPHSAAHYGHFVYKPLTVLSILDEGINPYTGVSLRLEGHLQNEAMFSPSQNSSSLVRFGQLNMSLVLQTLLPLLIIFLCHNAISKEKENGNLSIAVAQGNSLRMLAWGKIWAYTIWWVLFLSALLAVLWLVTTAFTRESLTWLRLGGVWGLYAVYYFMLTAISVYVSAVSKSSAAALVKLLLAWLICIVILPKASANIGENIHPLISKIELEKRISDDNKQGINGHDPSNERTIRFKDSLIRSYKVDAIDKVPVNIDGLTMQADEEYHNVVYDKNFGTVKEIIGKQNNIEKNSSWINPFAAVRNISMSLAGTDINHHFDFTDKAEEYRRQIIKKMNDEQAYGGSKTGDWDWSVKADYWSKIEDFRYTQPPAGWSVKHNYMELAALAFWVLLSVVLVHFTINRISIIR